MNAIWTPDEGTEEPWTITTQVVSGPMQAIGGDGSGTPASIVAKIQWMVGGATFSKVINLRNTVAQQLPVLARKVMVDLQVININNAVSHVDVAVGVARGGMLTSIERLAPSWAFSENLNGLASEVALGPGVLLSAIGIVGTAPTAGPYYPMFLDLEPGLALGALAGLFPFLVCTPITGAGQLFSMSDEFVAEFSFQKKLWFAWSTTPGHVTLPALGLAYCLNLKIGS
ncbi:MAG: hypothetical protein M3O46_19930 [Myxococcota bacterium]|nr:hypothetical protein [Myxococcota bacterium]